MREKIVPEWVCRSGCPILCSFLSSSLALLSFCRATSPAEIYDRCCGGDGTGKVRTAGGDAVMYRALAVIRARKRYSLLLATEA
ncbi:hypothetical protein KCP73_11175 [Salmonella enterica subsp. enterica]|nr:hypothetical protein KCP73_11175 [Salmonella enterica subsp. enterica]